MSTSSAVAVAEAVVAEEKPMTAKPKKLDEKPEKSASPKVNAFAAAMLARKAAIEQSAEIDQAGKNSQLGQLIPAIALVTESVFANAKAVMNQTDFPGVCKIIRTTSKKDSCGYVQVKTIVKLVKIMRSIAQGLKTGDGNLDLSLAAIVANDAHASIREVQIAQSKKVAESANQFDYRDTFKAKPGNYSKGTAKSQSGQVRECLRLFGLATVQKGKRNDDAALNEYGLSILKPIYGKK